MEIRGVKVYAHWSVLLIGAIVLMGAVSDPSTAIPGLLCYYSVILLHECGHMIVAQRKGYPVWSIEIYPIWGIARFSETRFDILRSEGLVRQTRDPHADKVFAHARESRRA